MFQKLGLVKAYRTDDQGRFDLTGDEADRRVFKVPSLRNIAETGPYFHDGSIASLEEAVSIMARHQLGKELSTQTNASIRVFLSALPKSGPSTPLPDPS